MPARLARGTIPRFEVDPDPVNTIGGISDFYFFSRERTVHAHGWFLSSGAGQSIEIRVDGELVGTADEGYPRPDILGRFPGYTDLFPGWYFSSETIAAAKTPRELNARLLDASGAILKQDTRIFEDARIGSVAVRALEFDVRRTIAGTEFRHSREVFEFLRQHPWYAVLRPYVITHSRRFDLTFRILEKLALPSEGDWVLDVGGAPYLLPAFERIFPEKRVAVLGSNVPPLDINQHQIRPIEDMDTHPLPWESGTASAVFLLEVVEHLYRDPMLVLIEANRVLVDGGILLVTTPNIVSWLALWKMIRGQSPYLWKQYLPFSGWRHVNEFSPGDIQLLLEAAGFEVSIRTENFYFDRAPRGLLNIFENMGCSTDGRNDAIVAIARKIGPVTERYPAEFYDQGHVQREQNAKSAAAPAP